ncbi:MAG: RsmB/NOP family class I SAM-dependent RNA methyltransferase [Deltaproteobacteria bacterium]|nr:RsmB/NOP family class I SAM-dependent RNA methyltransferase [Deltaproteobacteria bacterium]
MFENYRDIIPDFNAFQESLKNPLPVHLRVNRLKIEPPALMRDLRRRGIHVCGVKELNDEVLVAHDLKSPGRLIEYFLGYLHPQALTSCLVSLLLPVQSGSFVLDMCASPGGKTAHIAQRMQNTGLVVANELYTRRHIPLAHTLARLGVVNTIITGYQAQEFPLRQRFDFILADVPCSGEGRFRQQSEFSHYEERDSRAGLYELQRRVILRAFDLLGDNAEMVYATCTYNPEENESVTNFLLGKRDADLLPVHLGFPGEPGLLSWKGEIYDRRMERAIRFYPHRLDSVGFFMARIGKRS